MDGESEGEDWKSGGLGGREGKARKVGDRMGSGV